MQIEKYFDFLSENDIRFKGSRIGIETILYEYIHRDRAPEDIVHSYPSLSLEQVYAAILYYLHEKQKVNNYVANWLEQQHQRQLEQEANPHAGIVRLRQLVAEYGRDPLIYRNLRSNHQLVKEIVVPVGEI
jgi:uncharacterized protein (DUF433 family)